MIRLPILWCCAVILTAGEAVKTADLIPAKLVPATTMMVADGKGGSWPVDQQADLSGQSFNNLNSLMIDQRWQFSCQSQPQQTADGAELVLTGGSGNAPNGINVIRRVRSMTKAGAVRWVDILHNTGAATAGITVGLRTYFHYGPVQATGESGSPVNGPLGAKDAALVVNAPPNYGNNYPDVVFGFGSPRSKVRPSVTVMNNQLMVSWTLSIPAGRAVALVHCMTEKPQGTALGQIKAIVKPWRQASFLADLAPGLRRLLVNGNGAAVATEEAGLAAAIPEALIEARGDDADLLALGAGTRLRGDAASGDLTVAVDGERRRIPWAEVQALAGGATPRVFLRDGSVLTGVDPEATCGFALATGQTVKLAAARIGWVLRRPAPGEGLPPGEVLIETADRQRLVGRPGGSRLRCATVWGQLELRLEDIAALAPAESGGSQVTLRDGSRFTAFCTGGTIDLATRLTGTRRIPMASVVGIIGERRGAANGDEAAQDDDAQRGPWVQLAGGQIFAGIIDQPELHLRLEGNRLPVPPAQIRRLANLAEEAEGWQPRQPRVRLELWTGDVAEGLIEEVLVPVRTAGGRLMVPATDLAEVQVPTPVVAPATRARIAELVAQLGDQDWAKREAGVKALVRLGEVVRRDVEEALRTASDPEIKARLEQVVQELK